MIRILPKYKKLVEKRGDKEYYVRATFTNKNLDFIGGRFLAFMRQDSTRSRLSL